MKNENYQIGLGGGCHWCTEGIFQSLIGVHNVKQGWMSSIQESAWSEAVEVDFNPDLISLKDLIEIHLFTHSSTSNHSFRKKYRSAVYVYNGKQEEEVKEILRALQTAFEKPLITQVLTFSEFKLNKDEYLNYLYTQTDNPFCESYIYPKLSLLMKKFEKKVNKKQLEKLESLK